jgi:hypothetical protein
MNPSDIAQHRRRDVRNGSTPGANAEYEHEQFGVRQAASAEPAQSLARKVIGQFGLVVHEAPIVQRSGQRKVAPVRETATAYCRKCNVQLATEQLNN